MLLLDRIECTVSMVPCTFTPPTSFSIRFFTSLYLLDALIDLQKSHAIVIDPDVLCVRSLDAMLNSSLLHTGMLPLASTQDENINGISLQAKSLILLENQKRVPHLTDIGGECVIFPLI